MRDKAIIAFCFFLVAIAACKKEAENNNVTPNPPGTPDPIDTIMAVELTPYEIIPPVHFPEIIFPEDNMPSAERIRLGRMLYYDPILSNTGQSCSSCHIQSKGFTRDEPLHGVPVLPHVNLAWTTNFMWDGSVQGQLEDAMLYEVKDFFGTDLDKINQNMEYRILFKKYFGVNKISYKEISYALAQFVRTQVSGNSRYDRFLRGEEMLSHNEMQGRMLFFNETGDCFHCHSQPTTTDNDFHNTGLDSVYAKKADKGLYNVTGKTSDLGKFRTPNLRNVALRKYYMHDGRFTSLEEVLEFYNSGTHFVSNIDPIMTKAGKKEKGLGLTEQQKMQIIAFLHTMTDDTFLNDTTLSKLP